MHSSKVVVITGAAQGIGLRTAEVLGAEGYAIVAVDRQPIPDTLAQLSEAITVLGDITDESFIATLVATVTERYGRLDVLVNNAGISRIQRSETATAMDWQQVLAVNLISPFLLCQAFFPLWQAQRQGSIVNVASIAGLFGIADRAAYNASKHGLIGLTRTLAAEWGGQGIRCNAVCPGWVKTEMDTADQTRGNYTDMDITQRVPLGRFASPTDIAQAITYLADSSRSGFVNGHALVVDGGWTADATWESLRLARREP